jgi:tRNA (mo5U34)-methyltransferase
VTDARAAVDSVRLWYHTMELAPGVVTPGWFDLRGTLDRLPWPDVRGRRCLDVGTYDGHLAFELERRGAAEVVALDIADHESWDWPVRVRRRGIGLDVVAGEKGAGFRVARELLGSAVERVELSVYDLAPDRVGTFDVAVCGDLMLHLRDPVRAVEAIASVCTGSFLSTEEVLLGGDRPLALLDGVSDLCQWWRLNRAGHRRLLEAGGFDVEAEARPFCVAFGPRHPPAPRSLGTLRRRAAMWLRTRQTGVPHAALRARPMG